LRAPGLAAGPRVVFESGDADVVARVSVRSTPDRLASRKAAPDQQNVGSSGARPDEEDEMKPVFIQLQCAPGRTYEVADAIYALEVASELYSTSGEYDLLMKVYVEASEQEDIGKFINEKISSIPGIVRSLTTLTFRAF
jgi:DNA-binding Lrp family transcriptional regulator